LSVAAERRALAARAQVGGTKPELIERLLTKPRIWGAEKGAVLLSSFKAVTAPAPDVPGVPRSMLEVTDAAVLAKVRAARLAAARAWLGADCAVRGSG
jgi:hypothetical protein